MKSNKQLLEILDNIYFQVYAKIGKNWNEMKLSGETMQESFFENYTISQVESDKIMNECCKGLNKWDKKKISINYYLGCSPRFK